MTSDRVSEMPGLRCKACNKEFEDDSEQKIHNRSGWHRYNLKRQVAGLCGVTEARFLARKAALALEKSRSNAMVSESDLDPSCCFMCDVQHDSVERCMDHLHKQHGLFVPDVEYLKDPTGLLACLGLKVRRDCMCLYCNDRRRPFGSLEAVRMHMDAKGHCKVHYGDGGEDEEGELDEFYDYSSSFVDESGKQLVAVGDPGHNVHLGTAGAELIITRRTETGVSTKALGSREFSRYYRQKPRPMPQHGGAIAIAMASSYKKMGLIRTELIKETRGMERFHGVEAMRDKIGMKNNFIRNQPKKPPYRY